MLRLDLGNNNIVNVDAVCGCSELSELWIDQNELPALPAALPSLAKLSFLEAGGNLVARLPGELHRLNSLVSLHLQYNMLTHLPALLPPSLVTLNLHSNRLAALPPGVGLCIGLQAVSTEQPALSGVWVHC